MDIYEKRGYLNSEFRLFHLTDKESGEIKPITTTSTRSPSSSKGVFPT